jgi:hypothetical protein
LMTDPVKRRAMGDAGRAAFLEKYTLSKAAAAYDAVLSSLTDDGPSRIAARAADDDERVLAR